MMKRYSISAMFAYIYMHMLLYYNTMHEPEEICLIKKNNHIQELLASSRHLGEIIFFLFKIIFIFAKSSTI